MTCFAQPTVVRDARSSRPSIGHSSGPAGAVSRSSCGSFDSLTCCCSERHTAQNFSRSTMR